MHAPWVGQTDDGIYDVSRQALNASVPTHSALHIACLACISQSINQAKQVCIVTYVASESDAATTSLIRIHSR